jgi:hypothetical protein
VIISSVCSDACVPHPGLVLLDEQEFEPAFKLVDPWPEAVGIAVSNQAGFLILM